MLQLLWRVWQILTMLNIGLPWTSAITLVGVYTNGLKNYVHIKTLTQMFISALFIIVKNQRPSRCPSTGELINKCGTSKRWNIIQ